MNRLAKSFCALWSEVFSFGASPCSRLATRGPSGERLLEPKCETHRSCRVPARVGFTLIELLVVIAIIIILAAIAAPTLHSFRPNLPQTAARQLLNDLAHARQLAISQRTTVYMVFCPSNFWNEIGYSALPVTEQTKAQKLYNKQLISYALVSTGDVGDQPGRHYPRYWTGWRTLPAGTFIPLQKFTPGTVMNIVTNPQTGAYITITNFLSTNSIAFPSDSDPPPSIYLPYVAFNYLGQLTTGGDNIPPAEELIPIAQGSVNFPIDQNTRQVVSPFTPTINENPAGNSTNMYHIVRIDGVTGRGHLLTQEVQ
jgi:prepilin-type N-terminal cleavage/methylation domain-containing protein